MKRILSILLLSVMTVCLVALFIPNLEQDSLLVNTIVLNISENILSKKAVVIENSKLDIHCKLNNHIDSEIEKMNFELNKINFIEDKRVWFIAYKEIINNYSDVLDPPETIYDYYTDEELELLFRVVQAEVGDEYTFEAKVNVASVIFNRWMSDQYSGDIFAILIEKNQFQPIQDGRYKDVIVSEDTILACEYAFTIENTAQGCLFFDSNNTLNYNYVFSDEAHNFYSL